MKLLINLLDFARMALSRYVKHPLDPPEPDWTDGNP
jgi:hypothetical protein